MFLIDSHVAMVTLLFWSLQGSVCVSSEGTATSNLMILFTEQKAEFYFETRKNTVFLFSFLIFPPCVKLCSNVWQRETAFMVPFVQLEINTSLTV